MVVGLDIGTSNIRVAIGEVNESGAVEIVGTACKKSVGLKDGVIVNIEAAMNCIRETIEAAEQNAGMEVTSCITSIGGSQIEGINSKGVVAVSSAGKAHKEIRQDDVNRVLDAACAVQIPMDKETLHVIPQHYIVDGVAGIKNPIDRLGVRLEAEVHIITSSKTIIQNVNTCIQRANYMLGGVMLKTLASTKAVVHEDELDLGSIIIDLGAGTTDILVVINGAPVCTASIPVGGNLVTNDIHLVKGIPLEDAERIKINHGCCWLPNAETDMSVIIPGVGGRPPEESSQEELCQIIMPRMEEIFTMVRDTIINKTNISQLSGNIILVGGGANMNGVVELVQEVFGTSSVRIGIPEYMGGVVENYRNPEWSTAVGLIVANRNGTTIRTTSKRKAKNFDSKNKKSVFKELMKKLF